MGISGVVGFARLEFSIALVLRVLRRQITNLICPVSRMSCCWFSMNWRISSRENLSGGVAEVLPLLLSEVLLLLLPESLV